MRIPANKYKTADPKGDIIFLHLWQDRIHPVLAGRIAYVAYVKGEKTVGTSGFRSNEEQLQSQIDALAQHPNYHQHADGRVYNEHGQCMVSAVGQSSHNWGLAFDSHSSPEPTWLEQMTDAELRQYGLSKPMDYEPWHIECCERLTPEEKKLEFYDYMGGGYYPMDIRTFQMITGLKPDGVAGAKMQAKAQEVLECIGPELLKASTTKVQVGGSNKGIGTIAFAGTTYGPVRAIAESLDKIVLWDGKTKIITIK